MPSPAGRIRRAHHILAGRFHYVPYAIACVCDDGGNVCCCQQSDSNDNLMLGSIGQCDTINLLEDGGTGTDVDTFKSCCIDQDVGDYEKSATCAEG